MATDHRVEAADVPDVSKPSATRGPAASLLRGLWKIVVFLVVLGGLLWGGFVAFPDLLSFRESEDSRGDLTYEVHRTGLQVTVVAEGNVESGSNVEVKCRVAGGSTILWIVEDGKEVEEEEEIVRLDTSAIEDKLNSQRIVYEKALASHIQAEQDLEAAKIGVQEYEEGTFVEQLKQMEADIQIAMENLRSAESQLQYSRRMVRKGFASSLQREADEFAVERGKLDLDVATTRKNVLVEFTKRKMLKDLEAKSAAAAANLRAQGAGLKLEKDRLDRLQAQLKNCRIVAPKKGMVVYANNRGGSRFGSSQTADIEEGSMVRESQALVQLPDLTRMQVKVTIHESHVDKIEEGMPARVVIQDQEYDGDVKSVAKQPERTSWFSANVKEYATVVSIHGAPRGLRPGMTAAVTIFVDRSDDALTVPVSAVVEKSRGKFFCWVKTPGGPERRLLKLGLTNDKLIEVIDGVKDGDEVLRHPRAVVDDARDEAAFEEQTDPSARFETAARPDSASRRSPTDGGKSRGDAEAGDSSARAAGPQSEGSPGEGRGGPPRSGEGRRGSSRSGSGRGGFSNMMQFDKDGDGKLKRDELPERMGGFFDRLDANGDGSVDKSEIDAIRKRYSSGGGRGGSERPDSPDRRPGSPGGTP